MASLAWASIAAAVSVRTPHVAAELLAERTALVPGQTLTLGLRLRLATGWHVYWLNPGDSGVPTTIAWELPAGITAGPIQWPAPQALPAGPLVNHGYEGEVLHLVDLAVAPSLAPVGKRNLRARVDWLVCKEACLPETVNLELTLPIAATAAADPDGAAAIAAARRALPRRLSGWQTSATAQGASITLTLTPPVGAPDPGTLHFFPFAERQIEPSAPQTLTRAGGAYSLVLPVASDLAAPLVRLSGVLTASGTLGGEQRAAELDLPLAGRVVAGAKPDLVSEPATRERAGRPGSASPPPAEGALTIWLALLAALGGGALLNLMPCVFPVLSIKVLGLATHDDRLTTRRWEAFAYAGGVLLTFVALGLALFALRAAGDQLGWGFQLQSPVVVTALALLFFVLALNLSGVFEFGQFVPARLAGPSTRRRGLDAFFGGVLAVIVASPCTVPFMGAALGFALAASAWVTLLVFAALGAGMALPYVLLVCWPGWRRFVPRSGPWLEHLRQLLAYPLYATVIWLVWVLGAQTDNDSVLRLLLALLGVGFALWAWRVWYNGASRLWAATVVGAALAAAAVAWPLLTAGSDEPRPAPVRADTAALGGEANGEWQPYTPIRLAGLIGAGRTVFVDFTAAWCVTCQVNKRLVLNDAEVSSAFTQSHVARLRADWTRRDPAITQALTALGRSGVPVYVLYRPGREPLLLPEVLQRQTVLAALAAP
ncbi:protein-disulfide reductase DsbD [Accumulibacter sp.]|uniref:protein-disulfide reductase DsbD family protein n=1 Tax=Accumulibacter sp. TaxID=2053492 RepID=UPI002611303D|nr:protein-disulfide reductase DsbD domain-containing protein [Accumulibacter sp.]